MATPRKTPPVVFLLSAVALLFALVTVTGAVSETATRLRNKGYAELENEKPAEAEATFKSLLEMTGEDPLAAANLAVAQLRQQKYDQAFASIDRALKLRPERADLLAIRAEILQWAGKPDEGLPLMRHAGVAAPDDVETQYSLLRLASTLASDDGLAARDEALERLARLRPDNLVVLLESGQRAIERGDRAAASSAFLRVRELLWQAPPVAEVAVEQVFKALESGETPTARVPAMRLTNVLKVSSMYQQGLRELSTGIQAVPIARFEDEPAPRAYGKALEVGFVATRLSSTAASGRALTVGDFDGDERPDIAWSFVGDDGPRVELRAANGGALAASAGKSLERLAAADLDNDGLLELLGAGAGGVDLWRPGVTELQRVTGELLPDVAGGAAFAAFDFDIEGDLDLAVGGGPLAGLELLRNNLAGPLEAVGANALPDTAIAGVRDLAVSDLDRDGDLDLVVAHANGLTWLDNLRQGELKDRTKAAGLPTGEAYEAIASADLDNDGWPDLIAAGKGLRLLHNRGGRFEEWELGSGLKTSATFTSIEALDIDNDGRLDLATAGPGGLTVVQQVDDRLRFVPIEDAPSGAAALASADLDGDGDLDLVTAGEGGLYRLINDGGNRNGWLTVRLRGLTKGNSKNNSLGLGSTVEIRNGNAYQFREVTSDVLHLGLGEQPTADVLRVVWTNGVPQNRLAVARRQAIVEEQLLKGSCPFLYVWNGEEIEFVTDLLWGAPIGMPVAPGVWAGADAAELVRVDGAAVRDGFYDLRVTEELWEAAFFDHVALWVVDHPAEVEVATNLKVIPGEVIEDRVLATRSLKPVAAAWDAAGREVTDLVARRDEVYADGWHRSPYQGVASELWTFTLDLGEAPAAPIRLVLEGWIFPADASLNLALAQRTDLSGMPPRLEVETADGWQTLIPMMGFPAGKTKPMVVDTPPLPEDARRLRIVSGQWLSWDRIAWSSEPDDDDARVVAVLAPRTAELAYRGFSAPVRQAPNAPHSFDYANSTTESPWLPFPGPYTRFGDVRELLDEPDDLSVILAAGDEMTLLFDAGDLPPVAEGWRRTVFLESHGWDKDADRNTYRAEGVEPLPFRAMSGYPFAEGETFPTSRRHRRYVRDWLTRVIEPEPVGPAANLSAGR